MHSDLTVPNLFFKWRHQYSQPVVLAFYCYRHSFGIQLGSNFSVKPKNEFLIADIQTCMGDLLSHSSLWISNPDAPRLSHFPSVSYLSALCWTIRVSYLTFSPHRVFLRIPWTRKAGHRNFFGTVGLQLKFYGGRDKNGSGFLPDSLNQIRNAENAIDFIQHVFMTED